jgi:hypothetical protein
VTERGRNGRGVVEPRSFDLAAAVSDPAVPFDSRSFGRAVAVGDVAASPARPARSRPFDLAAHVSDPAPAGHPRALDPRQAELIAAAGAVVLVVSLLFLPWFGTAVATGRFASRAVTPGSEGAWHTLPLLRWLVLVAVVVAVLPLIIRPASRWLGLPRRTSAAIAALGGLTALLLGFRVLIDLPDPSRVVDQQVGAILGLLGALAIALGGLELMRAHAAERARARQARTRTRRTSVPPGELARVHA